MNPSELLESIFNIWVEQNYSDIHLNTWKKPIIRNNNWDISELEWPFPILDKKMITEIIRIITSDEWLDKFLENYELDSSYMLKNWNRYRINCYIDTNWYNIALRLIPNKIPTLELLWFGEQIKEMCRKSKWLILVTWPTWCWKSTNIAWMIDYINSNFNKHIITIEDPVEFSFIWKKSLINQREVWNHTKWFKQALRSVLREDPDVIVIWEMRDPETIKAAITLAETWHLVLSTLHTNDSVQSLDRIIDVFPWPQQSQIRMQLSQSLIWVISQRLIARSDKEWRIAAREILIANDAVKNLLITWKTHHLYSVLEVWQKEWMVLMDKYLLALYNKGIISKDTLMSYIRDKETIEMLLDNNK